MHLVPLRHLDYDAPATMNYYRLRARISTDSHHTQIGSEHRCPPTSLEYSTSGHDSLMFQSFWCLFCLFFAQLLSFGDDECSLASLTIDKRKEGGDGRRDQKYWIFSPIIYIFCFKINKQKHKAHLFVRRDSRGQIGTSFGRFCYPFKAKRRSPSLPAHLN